MISKIDLSALEPLYDKKYNCPFCSETFTSKKLRSRFVKPVRVERDFGPVFDQDDRNNPLYYYVTVCPGCGFSFTEDFSKQIGQAARKRVQKEITEKMETNTNYCGARDFDKTIRAYKLAIYAGQLVGERHAVLGNLCLRLAWLYRGAVRKEEETRFLQLARDEFEQSFLHTDFNPDTTPEIQVLYLVGELSRQLGEYHQAVKYFSTVMDHPDRSRYRKYVNLAREQWQLAAQQYRQESKQEE